MLTAKTINKFDLASQIPSHISFSEVASNVIGNKCNSWLECINLLIEHKCFSDAIILISCRMPVPLGIQWANWCIENVIPASLDKTKIDNHPSVWVEAASFWQMQYIETREAHLENLAKEAVYSAVYLCARADDFKQITFLRILDKGITLDQIQ